MSTISVQDIQRDPVSFLRRIEAGESFQVVRGASVLAEVRASATSEQRVRPYGLAKNQFHVPDDFDHPLPEDVVREFEAS